MMQQPTPAPTHIPTSTTFEIPGYRVLQSYGVVRGITVRTRSLPMTILGGLRTIIGGRAGIFTQLCETTREEAFQLMLDHARKVGANAALRHRPDGGRGGGAVLWHRSGGGAS